jgi:hypothetical protein
VIFKKRIEFIYRVFIYMFIHKSCRIIEREIKKKEGREGGGRKSG